MIISFLVEVDVSLTKNQPTVKISCDNEYIPQHILDLAAENLQQLADQQREINAVKKVV